MQPIQSVIVLLLVANLAATIWFGARESRNTVTKQAGLTENHELPSVITSDVRQDILDKFSKAFNNQNMDSLYNMFGPAAKAQLSRNEVESQFIKLFKYFGTIEDGAYVYSELTQSKGDTKIYTMHYVVKLPEGGEFGTKGTLRITMAVQGDDYEIYGIHLNAGMVK